MPTQSTDWYPSLDDLTIGRGLPEGGQPLTKDQQRIEGVPILYPHKASEAHHRAWRALYDLRKSRRQVMEFRLTVGVGVAPILSSHREIFLHAAGQALAAFAVAITPPQGQPMILDVKRRGESIFEPGSFTIPEGFTDCVKLDRFVFDPLEAEECDLFRGEIHQLGTTVKGEGVSIYVVWEVQD